MAGQETNDVRVPMTAGRLGLVDFLKQTRKQVSNDHVGAFAGNLAYHGLLGLFPFLIFVVSMLGIVGADQILTDGLERIDSALPAEARTLIVDQIARLTDGDARGAFTVGAIVSALLALYGVSGAMRSTMEALNVMYGVEDRRGLVKRYVVSVVLSLATVMLFLGALTLVVAGPIIARAIAGGIEILGDAFVLAWTIAQWPVLLLLVLLAFALIYWQAPDVDQEFRFITPGALAATLLWLVFSLAFAAYVNNFGSYNATYGTLAGLVVMLLYLYWSSFLLLLGAEMTQVIEEAHPEGKDEGERS